MSLEDAWHARPQLFFKCILRPQNRRHLAPHESRGPDDLEATLVLKLHATGPMDSATTKLYEPSPTPILYVARCELMLGRVPLFPCFLQGNATPTRAAIPPRCGTSRPARFSTG